MSVFEILREFLKLIGTFATWFLRYPVTFEYVRQFETKIGYVFVVKAQTWKNRVITVPKDRFEIQINLDSEFAHKMDKSKLVYGERVHVYESELVLNADIEGRSRGNVLSYVLCHRNPQRLFLLVRVEGPGNQNPSRRFRLGKVYQTARIKLRKRLLSLTYLEIPIKKVPIISGNEKTRIVDS